jgi:hypothetical protein
MNITQGHTDISHMSINSLASSEQLMASVISLNYTDNQEEIFENIRINAYHMKKALVSLFNVDRMRN